ncbi:MAG TPA: hypothetical protein VKN64_02045 [Halanaerobiales bacterium]|nr:hypothetical protein [Halanaerobiales bacterium]
MDKKINNIINNTYFIGGSPCSGKSTTAEMLSEKYNLEYYKIDDYEFTHLDLAEKEKHPTMFKYKQMSWDEIWMRDPYFQAEEEYEFYRERFGFVIDGLKKYDKNDKLIIEGAALLPELINGLPIDNNRVLYMVPEKEFQIKHYTKRSFKDQILKECSDPEQAFANWMERDYIFAQMVKAQADNFGYKTIEVDGSNTIQKNVDLIVNHFKLNNWE